MCNLHNYADERVSMHNEGGQSWLTINLHNAYADERVSMHNEGGEAWLTIDSTRSTDTGCYAVQLMNIHGSERMYSSVTIEGNEYSWLGTNVLLCHY